jgi:hypothetical protein
MSHDWGEIADDHADAIGPISTFERKHTVRCIIGFDPSKTAWAAIELVQRFQVTITTVQIANQVANTGMLFLTKKMPVQRSIVIPLSLLCKLATPKKKLLAWMGPHEREIGA